MAMYKADIENRTKEMYVAEGDEVRERRRRRPTYYIYIHKAGLALCWELGNGS